jgi:hypothetical protein
MGAQYSTSSLPSGGDDDRYPTNNYNKETQLAILTALTKLQQDVHNILERLNRLETSAYLLQQVWNKIDVFHRYFIGFILERISFVFRIEGK